MQIIKSTKALRLSLRDCDILEGILRQGKLDIREALIKQAANYGFDLSKQINGGWSSYTHLISDIELPQEFKGSILEQYIKSITNKPAHTDSDRQLNSVRNILKRLFTGQLKNDPAIRLSYQITDLALLKYALAESEETDSTIYSAIDASIEGFIWLYKHGGTTTTLPDIINNDVMAQKYYKSFTDSWHHLQNYMSTHMYLMDK